MRKNPKISFKIYIYTNVYSTDDDVCIEKLLLKIFNLVFNFYLDKYTITLAKIILTKSFKIVSSIPVVFGCLLEQILSKISIQLDLDAYNIKIILVNF